MTESTEQQVQEEVKYDRKDLRILALKQDLGDLHEKVADLRAELSETIDAANKQIQSLAQENAELKAKVGEEDEVPDEKSSSEPSPK